MTLTGVAVGNTSVAFTWVGIIVGAEIAVGFGLELQAQRAMTKTHNITMESKWCRVAVCIAMSLSSSRAE
jgi:hypothetical protein